MKRLFMLLAAAMMLGVAMPTMAQTELFTEQTKFIVPKGSGSINIRKSPNAKSQKVATLGKDETLPVLSEQNGWYQVLLTDCKKGWVSKSVCRISDAPLDVTKICDHVFGISVSYDESASWTVAQLKGTDMFVAITDGVNVFTPVGSNAIWLGKKVGNTLVFDQYVPFGARYSSENPSRFDLYPGDNYYKGGYELYFGDKYEMPDNQGGSVLRPSTLDMGTIKKIFDGKQRKDGAAGISCVSLS